MSSSSRHVSTTPAATTALLLAAVIGSTVLCGWLLWASNSSGDDGETIKRSTRRRRPTATSKKKNQQKKGVLNNNNNNDSDKFSLPPHLNRELAKDQRRQHILKLFTMKKPMYDNIFMFDPHGNLLCTISKKKAAWYIRKQLAEWWAPPEEGVGDGDEPKQEQEQQEQKSIRLLFEPQKTRPPPSSQSQPAKQTTPGITNTNDDDNNNNNSSSSTLNNTNSNANIYNQTPKQNCCVVCGSEDDYMRHYVVPYCYRNLFPQSYKTHLPHDVVLLCAKKHHLPAEQAAHRKKTRIEKALRKEYEQRIQKERKIRLKNSHASHLIDEKIKKLVSCAGALLNYREKLPASRIREYTLLIQAYLQSQQQQEQQHTEELTREQLIMVSELNDKVPNPDYISGPDLVLESLLDQNASETDDYHQREHPKLSAFIREWRQHFEQTLHPRHLPAGWSIDSPVQSDIRTSRDSSSSDNKGSSNNNTLNNQLKPFLPQIRAAARAIQDCNYLLVATGAGCSADSGLPTYNQVTAQNPIYNQMGVDYADLCRVSCLRQRPALFGGFWANMWNAYQEARPHEGYDILKRWCERKEEQQQAKIPTESGSAALSPYYHYTSNVDGYLKRVGFPIDNIHEMHGCIDMWFTLDDQDFSTKSSIALPSSFRFSVNQESLELHPDDMRQQLQAATQLDHDDSSSSFIARPRVLMFDDDFKAHSGLGLQSSSDRYQAWEAQMEEKMSDNATKKLVVLEVGCGLRVPSVRQECHDVICDTAKGIWNKQKTSNGTQAPVSSSSRCIHIRINPYEYAMEEPPTTDEGCLIEHISIPGSALDVLKAIDSFGIDAE